MYSEEEKFVKNYQEIKESKTKHNDALSVGEILTYRRQYEEITRKENEKLMDQISQIGNPDDPKVKSMLTDVNCNTFKMQMLDNGWSPADLPALDKMYREIEKMPDSPQKNFAKINRDAVSQVPVTSVQEKVAFMESVSNNLPENVRTSLRNDIVDANRKYVPTALEYKNPEELKRKFFKSADVTVEKPGKNKKKEFEKSEFNAEVLKDLQEETKRHKAPENEQQRKQLRNKKDYIVGRQTEEELHTHTKNKSEKNFKAKMSIRDAVVASLNPGQNNPYNKIDQLRKDPNRDNRKVDIHHSRGSAQLQSGENVLEIDFAGSGFAAPRKVAHGIHGKPQDVNKTDEELLRAQYGEIREDYPYAKPADSKNELTKNYVRSKTQEEVVNGRRVTKERISIPGPLAKDFAFDLVGKEGASDSGPYKIENTSNYARDKIINFIGHNQAIDPNKKIHINLEGHSRGAVSVSQTIKKVLDFAEDGNNFPTPEDHNRFKEYIKNNVQFDIVQRDPVPGPINIEYDEFNYDSYKNKGYHNLNITSIYTMNADATMGPSWLGGKALGAKSFEPQLARGQDRIIIGNTPHSAGLEGVDFSQKNVAGDGKAHKWGYLDAETKQFYRGSGVSEMPKGIYLADEKNNLIRVTNYSQLDNVLKNINGDSPTQEVRQNHIREMAKHWFVDHPELITGNDGMTSEQAINSVTDTFAKPKTAVGKQYKDPLQNAIKEYNIAQNSPVSANGEVDGFQLTNYYTTPELKEAAVEAKRNALIDVCKDYMRNQQVSLIGMDARRDQKQDRDWGLKSRLADPKEFKAVCDLYCHLNAEKNNRPKDTIERNLDRLKEQSKTERGNNLETVAAEKIYYDTLKRKAESLHNYNAAEIVENLAPDAVRTGVAAIKESAAFRGILRGKSNQQIGEMISDNRIHNEYMQEGERIMEVARRNADNADKILAGRALGNDAPQAENNQIRRKNSF